jgi:hypothetical protein
VNAVPSQFKILDKRRFLIAAMNALSGNAHISFEGDLKSHEFSTIAGHSFDEAAVLKRNALWPKQDFVVLPLESGLVDDLCKAIGGTVPRAIIHIQIEKDGKLALGLYDNFQANNLAGLDRDFLETLQSEDIVRLRT